MTVCPINQIRNLAFLNTNANLKIAFYACDSIIILGKTTKSEYNLIFLR